jgi:uncharacterized membrane protein
LTQTDESASSPALADQTNEPKLKTTMETTPSTSPTPPPVAGGEDKTVAIVSYLTLIGFIVALILHSSKKTALGTFHLRQTLGLFLTAIVLMIALWILFFIIAFIPIVHFILILAPIVSLCLWLGFFVLWLMGLIAAINGQQKPMPVVGEAYQKWFGNAFA